MLDLHFFSHHRLKPKSCEKFEATLRALAPLIDPVSWNRERHEPMLRRRLENKIALLRKQLIKGGEIVKRGHAFERVPVDMDHISEHASDRANTQDDGYAESDRSFLDELDALFNKHEPCPESMWRVARWLARYDRRRVSHKQNDGASTRSGDQQGDFPTKVKKSQGVGA